MENLTQLTPPVVLVIALNTLGWGLKQSPIPNWLIPLILPLIGAALYPFIAEVGKVVVHVQYPIVYQALIGFALGSASVGMNQAIKQFVQKNENNP